MLYLGKAEILKMRWVTTTKEPEEKQGRWDGDGDGDGNGDDGNDNDSWLWCLRCVLDDVHQGCQKQYEQPNLS